MNTTPRLHALDNLRALMMWLGIVLHVAIQHVAGPSALPWRDPAQTPLADLLFGFIHAYRMPVFFVLAGFFMALLIERRGVAETLKHRLRRLALPFVIFWPLVFVAMSFMVLAFVHRMAFGTWGLDPALMPPMPPGTPQVGTMHLWFVYLLIGFSLLTTLVLWLAPRLPLRVRATAGAVLGALAALGGRGWGPLLLALPLAWAGSAYPLGLLVSSGSFLPPWQEWLHNGVFFVFGLGLYGQRERLFAHFVARWGWYAAAGGVAFGATVALIVLPHEHTFKQPALIAYVYGLASWVWSFALIGLFLKYVPAHHPVLGYLAESAYWVYIVHMIGTIGIGAVLVTAPLPALAKMAINITATSALALLSYQLFVRHTWIGRLLNGPSRAPDGISSAAGARA